MCVSLKITFSLKSVLKGMSKTREKKHSIWRLISLDISKDTQTKIKFKSMFITNKYKEGVFCLM